uniref:ARAD1C44836p n=1 Tax=Blastobotrys adeninivorans TaxID=409370 RepID=A0A060T4G4_BLAAD
MSIVLDSPPRDLISSVRFSPVGNVYHLLVSSWDEHLRVYDTSTVNDDGGRVAAKVAFRGPILDSCWDKLSGEHAYVVGFSRRCHRVDLETGKKMKIGKAHEQAVKCVVHDTTSRTVITGSWDRTLQQIDYRSSNGPARTVSLPGKVIAMDTFEHRLVVGMDKRQFHIYDVRNLSVPLEERESSLKHPTRTLRCSPDGTGYITTSLEGRVAVEFFDQGSKYAFKCHRIVDKKGSADDIVTPINALAFHPKYGTFFTGASDRQVILWDHKARKKWRTYPEFDLSIMSLDVNPTAELLAVGTSDDRYVSDPVSGAQGAQSSKIFIRNLAPEEGRSRV